MNRFLALILILLFQFQLIAKDKNPPKLIVLITVDQMRYDYLNKYANRYTENGFKRLLNNGFTFENANFSYAPTLTAVGHATIGTGTTPVHHGIAANDWYSRDLKRTVYCVEDSTVQTIGSPSEEGKYSPINLKTNTFSDQLKIRNPESKVLGISLKDRGAILPVGFNADAAYWLSNEGSFISSSYYMNELPKWLIDFNAKKMVVDYLKNPWETLYPIESYTTSTVDNAENEGTFKGEEAAVFPHNLPAFASIEGLEIIRETPFGNSLLTNFAKELIRFEKLGKDNKTDFLSISFSSTDYVGHRYGPQSIEIEDTYLRLDIEIANLIQFIEDEIGKENYLIVLTADHGVADIPSQEKGADYYNSKTFKTTLKDWSKVQYGVDLIEKNINHQIYLDHTEIASHKLNMQDVKRELLNFLLQYPSISAAADMSQRICIGDESVCERMFNGFDPKRSGDVFYSFQAGYLSDYYQRKGGTGHSTAYKYDTHVPMIWYGWNIPQGKEFSEVAIKDIASTLSSFLKIPYPNGATGKSLQSYMEIKR